MGKYLGEKHILNQPNSVYGMAFYAFLALLSMYLSSNLSIESEVFVLL